MQTCLPLPRFTKLVLAEKLYMCEIEFLHTHCNAKQFLPISNPNTHLI